MWLFCRFFESTQMKQGYKAISLILKYEVFMKNTVILIAVTMFLLGGCSTPTKLIPAVKEDISRKGSLSSNISKEDYFKNAKLIDTNTPALSYMQQYSHVVANRTVTTFMCNYFVKEGCSENDRAKNTAINLKLSNEANDIYKLYGKRLYVQFNYVHPKISNAIRQDDTVFKVIITGLSTKQRLIVFPKVEKKKLKLSESLQGKLRPDWRGFVISGKASIRIPDEFLSGADKGARLVLPVKFGRESDFIANDDYDDDAFAVQNKRYNKHYKLDYLPDTFSSTYYGQVTGFKLLDKMAEYAGWVNDQYMGELIVSQKIKAQEYKNKRDQEEKKFKAEVAAINNSLINTGLVKEFNHFSEINEVCTKLRSGSRHIDSFDCEHYRKNLVSGCKSTLRRYERRYDKDIAEICPAAEKYNKKFSSMFSQQSQKSFESVLREYEQKNSVTGRSFEDDFPYTRFDTDDLAKQLSNAEHDMDKAWMKGIQEKSNSDLRRKLMGLDQPSATDKMFKKFYKDTRDFAANDKRLNEESKRSSYKYTKPDSKSALAVSSKNKTKESPVVSASASNGNGRVTQPEGFCDTRNLPSFTTQRYEFEGTYGETEAKGNELSKKIYNDAKEKCGDKSFLIAPHAMAKCEGGFRDKARKCVITASRFTCGCGKRGNGSTTGRSVSK